MGTIRTKHDSIVLINKELRTTIQNLSKIKLGAEIQNTEAYELIEEYQKKLTTMHYELLDLVNN